MHFLYVPCLCSRCCQVHDQCFSDAMQHDECWPIVNNPYTEIYSYTCDKPSKTITCPGECSTPSTENDPFVNIYPWIGMLCVDKVTQLSPYGGLHTCNYMSLAVESYKYSNNLEPLCTVILITLSSNSFSLSEEKNDPCELFICECDRKAAMCFAQQQWNPDHSNLPSDQCK